MNNKPKLYGISNCDTVKKAKKFLSSHAIEFEFMDLKKIDQNALLDLIKLVGWEGLINLKSRTYKQLSPTQLEQIQNQDVAVVLDNTSLIKRPILQINQTTYSGFFEGDYLELCKNLCAINAKNL